MIRHLRAALALALAGTAAHAAPVECSDVDHAGSGYTVCTVNVAEADLRLFLYDGKGEVLGQFGAIDRVLEPEGKTLVFAMNAGMYHPDRAPVGHYVEKGEEVMRVVPGPGPGNFGLVPNGVFCIREDRADVVETQAFLDAAPDCDFATQSGPMLVIDGELHPRFLPDSTSRYVRNGVGTSADGQRAVFVISRNAVTFHEFGSLFRDVLKMPNALYFDGNISRLYATDLGRSDAGFAMGPVVGVVAPQAN